MATTATITSQSAWPDGQLQYVIAYVTDAGDVVERRGSVPAGTDLQAVADAHIPVVEAQLARQEIDEVLG